MQMSMKLTGSGKRKLRRIGQKIKKANRKSLKEVGKMVEKDVKQRIAVAKTDPAGKKWAPWAPSTLMHRIREGTFARGLLNVTGTLLGSFPHKVRGNSVQIGTNNKYAKYIQAGTSDMKKRELVNLNTPRMKKMIRKIFRRNFGKI